MITRILPLLLAAALVASPTQAQTRVIQRPVVSGQGQSAIRLVAQQAESPPSVFQPAPASPEQVPGVEQADPPPQPMRPDLTSPEAVPAGRPALTLAELEQMALANSPVLAQAAARIEAARGRFVQGGLQRNPVIGYSGEDIGDEGTSGKQGGFISQEFTNKNKLALNQAVASREILEAQRQLDAQRMRVVNDVRIQFYNVLVAQEVANFTQRLAGIAEKGTQIAERLLKALEGSRIDLLQAEVEAESARLAAENAQNRLTAAWQRLAAVVGAPQMPFAPLAGNINDAVPTFTFEEAIARILAQSPELAANRAAIARAQAVLARARVELLPDLQLEATTHYDNATGDTVAGVQAGISIPLWNKNQGGIREAQANLRDARANLARTELAFYDRLALAFESYINARIQVERYSTSILPKAQRSLELVTQGYEQGEFNFLTLLTAQRTYFQTNLSYLNAVAELRARAVEIEGLLLTGSLGDRPAPSERPAAPISQR